MRILIATPLYPPDIGGPATYAKNLEKVWQEKGYKVLVVRFDTVLKYPTIVRHFIYFLRLLFLARKVDFILILDTFSVGLPAVAVGLLLNKKTIIRTGGDFLWESYIERTGDLVLFRKFYESCFNKLSIKEKFIYYLTKFVLLKAGVVAFSTDWQRQIFVKSYGVSLSRSVIIENYYGPKEQSNSPISKVFIGATRSLKWKNQERLIRAIEQVKGVSLDMEIVKHDQFIEKIKNCYGVILVSLGDISPNLILEAVRFNKPFILTVENGLESRLKDLGLRVDPENIDDIVDKIKMLFDEKIYQTELKKIEQFDFVHDWDEIGLEFLSIFKRI